MYILPHCTVLLTPLPRWGLKHVDVRTLGPFFFLEALGCAAVCDVSGAVILFQLVTVHIPPGILARNRQACVLLVEARQACLLHLW